MTKARDISTRNVNFKDKKFLAGGIWGATYVLGGWLIAMVMNYLPKGYSLLLIPPLMVWGLTWLSSQSTRNWCMKFVLASKRRRT
jgi:hypothetical protein